MLLEILTKTKITIKLLAREKICNLIVWKNS
jgi:hypothetical protein